MGSMSFPAQMVRNMGRNMAYNLGFIAADKLAWKPAPTAKSALEIVNHTAYFQLGLANVLAAGTWSEPSFEPATDLESARRLTLESSERLSNHLEGVKPEDLGRTVTLPFGTFPLGRLCSMGTVDLVHHHGQIAYIQTLLGDAQDHFDPELMNG